MNHEIAVIFQIFVKKDAKIASWMRFSHLFSNRGWRGGQKAEKTKNVIWTAERDRKRIFLGAPNVWTRKCAPIGIEVMSLGPPGVVKMDTL